ncbi:MAG: methyltransferase, TrmH family [Frankiales bacterium]|nr:methyltransferase, TrmH family [Frankiales bacterium]
MHSVAENVAEALSSTRAPQGIVAVCDIPRHTLDEAVVVGARLVSVLADVADPGNAGTAIRTADAAGADSVVLTGSAVDAYNGKCVRASAGSLFHLPVVTGVDSVETLNALRRAGLTIRAADARGNVDLDDLIADGRLAAPTAWVFGNEARGLGEASSELADETVRIPLRGRAESLNLAAAVAVCLFATARAQR